MQALTVIAGRNARQRIEENGGLTPDMVRMILGASGGPKWLILRGLDDLIFGEWLANAPHDIDLLGTSIGSWRMAMAATADPGKSFDRFIESYLQMRFEKGADYNDWTDDTIRYANLILADGRKKEIAENTDRRFHAIAVRARGLAGRPNSPRLNMLGMAKVGISNMLGRDRLAKTFDRVLFASDHSKLPVGALQGFNFTQAKVLPENIADIMIASGSIPGLWREVMDIATAPKGAYRDGGVTDYHFSQEWKLDKGIVLYPHFYSYMIPGWFDKALKSRRVTGAAWDDLLMLSPTPELVKSLPGGKLTDRKDFKVYDNDERIAHWKTVVQAGYRMADEFNEYLNDGSKLIAALQDAP